MHLLNKFILITLELKEKAKLLTKSNMKHWMSTIAAFQLHKLNLEDALMDSNRKTLTERVYLKQGRQ